MRIGKKSVYETNGEVLVTLNLRLLLAASRDILVQTEKLSENQGSFNIITRSIIVTTEPPPLPPQPPQCFEPPLSDQHAVQPDQERGASAQLGVLSPTEPSRLHPDLPLLFSKHQDATHQLLDLPSLK
jgi:hypothetical protein